MAIREEKRRGAPIPSVETTAYGAEYVHSATETPVVEEGAAEGVDAVAEQQLTENVDERQVQEAEDAQKEQEATATESATAIESATVDAMSVKVEDAPVEATTAPARKKGGRPKKK